MRAPKGVMHIVKRIILYCFLGSILLVLAYRFIPPPFTPLMLIRCVQQGWAGRPVRLIKDWTPVNKMAKHMAAAVIASEDQNFATHHGFDTEAIRKAYKTNARKKKVRGASTITQQVAKNVFLWPQRSYVRKAIEAYFTVLIELLWSKKRILEVYLNVVELGDGIYGAEAASQTYYHRSVAAISKSEAALLAAVLPSPLKWSPVKPSGYILQRKNWISGQMAHAARSATELLK